MANQIYYYLIDTLTNSVVACFGTAPKDYSLYSNYILRAGSYGTDTDKLYYDPKTDSIKEYTAEQYLERVKALKLAELKAQIQAEFADVNDMMADIVKALKLVIKYALVTDPNEKNSLGDFLKESYKELDMLYPDNYARHCVAQYIKALLSKMPLYYAAKMKVMAAKTIEEVEQVQLEQS